MPRIVGYMFKADLYCPEHILEEHISPLNPKGADVESYLDYVAGVRLIDRSNESSFDSEDFPKVVSSLEVAEGDVCGNYHCGRRLSEV